VPCRRRDERRQQRVEIPIADYAERKPRQRVERNSELPQPRDSASKLDELAFIERERGQQRKSVPRILRIFGEGAALSTEICRRLGKPRHIRV
jgi:hypothetical protein